MTARGRIAVGVERTSVDRRLRIARSRIDKHTVTGCHRKWLRVLVSLAIGRPGSAVEWIARPADATRADATGTPEDRSLAQMQPGQERSRTVPARRWKRILVERK
jgi:hypothetical protein